MKRAGSGKLWRNKLTRPKTPLIGNDSRNAPMLDSEHSLGGSSRQSSGIKSL